MLWLNHETQIKQAPDMAPEQASRAVAGQIGIEELRSRVPSEFEERWLATSRTGKAGVNSHNQMPEQDKHILSSYDAALYGLRNDILMMSSLTDRILQTAFEAFLTRNSLLCDQVIAEDEEIDTLEKQVDEDGVGLLTRFHPVASDLRQVISAMKVSTNLECIGDQSVTIARRAKCLSSRPLVSEVALLEPAYRVALAIFRDSIRAFAESDCALARTLKTRDKELEALTTNIGEKLMAGAAFGSKVTNSEASPIAFH
jgi:phosphate transport system protein